MITIIVQMLDMTDMRLACVECKNYANPKADYAMNKPSTRMPPISEKRRQKPELPTPSALKYPYKTIDSYSS